MTDTVNFPLPSAPRADLMGANLTTVSNLKSGPVQSEPQASKPDLLNKAAKSKTAQSKRGLCAFVGLLWKKGYVSYFLGAAASLVIGGPFGLIMFLLLMSPSFFECSESDQRS